MNTGRSIEYLTGFLMGAFFGFLLESAFIGVFNLLASWAGWTALHPAWWMWIPLPLVLGLFMAKAIAALHLEDY